jgi:cob(I)alamin adenosyltransferase
MSLAENRQNSSHLKRNRVLAKPTQLNSIEQEGTRKELSEEHKEPIREIEGKLVEEGKDLNQENKTKTEMSNNETMEAMSAKKSTIVEFDNNCEDSFDFVLNKQINQCQLVVITSTILRAHSCRIKGQYKKFDKDKTTLQHVGWWSIGILG